MAVSRQQVAVWRPKPLPELERVRRIKGFSQRALARIVDVNHSHISRIEYRDRTASEALRVRIAEALDTPVDALFDVKGTAR